MKECTQCSCMALELCTICKIFVCRQHRITHQEENQKRHNFEKLKVKLTTLQISEIVDDLSAKIKHVDDCEKQIIEKLGRCSDQNQKIYKHYLNITHEQREKYSNLLKHCQESLFAEKMEEIKIEVRKSLKITVPTKPYKYNQNICASNLFKESEKISDVASMSLVDARHLLFEHYGLSIDTGLIENLVISNNLKFIVSSSFDNSVRIWRLKNQKQVAILEGHTGIISGLQITRDSKYIVSASTDNSLRIWNLKNRQLEAALRDNIPAYLIETSSDSKHIVSAHDNNSIKIWNIQDRVLEAIFKGSYSRISCIEILNGNKYIVSAHVNFTIRIWNFLDKIPNAIFTSHSANVFFAITNDGKYLAHCGGYHNLILWSLEDNANEASLGGHTEKIAWINTTYDNKYFISSSEDMTLRLWNIQAKKVEAILRSELFSIPRILIIHQARYSIVNNNDKNILTWINQPQIEHSNSDHALEFAGMTDDNKYSVYNDKSIIELWNSFPLDKIRKSDLHTHPLSCLAIASDNTYLVSGSIIGTLRVWSLQEKCLKMIFRGHRQKEITCISITSDNKYIISGSKDKTVRMWNFQNKKHSYFRGHNKEITSIALISNDKYIVSGSSDNTIRVWDIKRRLRRSGIID